MNLLDSSEQRFSTCPSGRHLTAISNVRQILSHLNPNNVEMNPLGYISVDWGSVKTYRAAIDSFPIPLTYKISDDEILQVRHKYKE